MGLPEVVYEVGETDGRGRDKAGTMHLDNGIRWVYFEGKRYDHSLCMSATVIIISFTELKVASSRRENRICFFV